MKVTILWACSDYFPTFIVIFTTFRPFVDLEKWHYNIARLGVFFLKKSPHCIYFLRLRHCPQRPRFVFWKATERCYASSRAAEGLLFIYSGLPIETWYDTRLCFMCEPGHVHSEEIQKLHCPRNRRLRCTRYCLPIKPLTLVHWRM